MYASGLVFSSGSRTSVPGTVALALTLSAFQLVLVGACGTDNQTPGSAGTVGQVEGRGGEVGTVGGTTSSGGAPGAGASPAASGNTMGGAFAGAGGTPGTGEGASGGVPQGGAATGGRTSGGGTASGGTTATNGCPVALMGFATVNGTTTGGGDAPPTTVKTYAELKTAVSDDLPRVIVVSGTIKTTDGGGYGLPIGSNKTLQGADKGATIYGGIAITGVNNVIVRNLNIHGIYPNPGPDDAIAVKDGSHHVWLDHLNVWDSGDGSLDITKQANYVTVSWCKFWYTDKKHPHRLCSLIGSGGGDHPEDWDHLKVTFHHNWFAELVDQRMPRLVYGQAHIFNDYYTSSGNSYCIGVGSYGSALIENNYFQNVNDPITFLYDVHCEIVSRGNFFDKQTTGRKDNGHGGSRDAGGQDFAVAPFTTPPYEYSMDKAEDVPSIVTQCAGPQ